MTSSRLGPRPTTQATKQAPVFLLPSLRGGSGLIPLCRLCRGTEQRAGKESASAAWIGCGHFLCTPRCGALDCRSGRWHCVVACLAGCPIRNHHVNCSGKADHTRDCVCAPLRFVFLLSVLLPFCAAALKWSVWHFLTSSPKRAASPSAPHTNTRYRAQGTLCPILVCWCAMLFTGAKTRPTSDSTPWPAPPVGPCRASLAGHSRSAAVPPWPAPRRSARGCL
jgi:hypothetical protein